MSKLRLLFIKKAQASYISHLDLLRTFQRAFPRTELDIKHSQGYHPHPIISIVLPLPVGQSSDCELLDFEVTQDTDGSGIAEKLNTGMPSGLRVLDCYPATRPVRDLAYLRADVTFEYDNGVPAGAAEALTALFTRSALVIQKRTKRKDLADVDIAPMIQEVHFLSGVYQGRTTGDPLAAVIYNGDARSADYDSLKHKPRPSHGDYTAAVRALGCNDPRGGGHTSGRLTAPLTVAGALAITYLKTAHIAVHG